VQRCGAKDAPLKPVNSLGGCRHHQMAPAEDLGGHDPGPPMISTAKLVSYGEFSHELRLILRISMNIFHHRINFTKSAACSISAPSRHALDTIGN